MIPETNPPPEPTIIPGTYPIPTTQPDETFDSPSLVTNNKGNIIQDTPKPNNVSTPESTPTDEEDNNGKSTQKTKRQLKLEYKTFKAKNLLLSFSKPASAISGNLQKLRNKKEIQLLPYQCTID